MFRLCGAAVVLVLASAFSFSSGAHADVIIDTGPGSNSAIGGASLFYTGPIFQFLGAEFTVKEPFTIGRVEGWMRPPSGTLMVKLYSSAGNLPGAMLEQQGFPVSYTDAPPH